jgi:predicted metal-dependent hydrolase
MVERIDLGGIAVHVVQKDIKNIHLSVYPPTGEVRISAPLRMDLDTVRVFAISKLSWIRQQRKKILMQERETNREYLNRESHYVWGKRYLLKIVEKDAAPLVDLRHSQIFLQIRPATGTARREAVLENWYRTQLKTAARPLIANNRKMGVVTRRAGPAPLRPKNENEMGQLQPRLPKHPA